MALGSALELGSVSVPPVRAMSVIPLQSVADDEPTSADWTDATQRLLRDENARLKEHRRG
jgi:hypothetical protein